MHLYQIIGQMVDKWRHPNYPHSEFSVIAEILEWATNPLGVGFRLRKPQVRALETYWYLRLIEKTRYIVDLYKKCFPKRAELLTALGIPNAAFERVDYELETLWQSIRDNDNFVCEFTERR